MRALEIDSIVACAIALAALALLLLWRQHRLRAELGCLRERLRRESKRRELGEQALAQSRIHLCRLGASQQALKDAERRRIARDLHDDLGQQLLALSFDFSTLAAQHPDLRQPLALIDSHLQRTIRALRAIVRDLQPEALEGGLRRAMQKQLEQFTRVSGVPCRLDAEAAVFETGRDDSVDAAIYRIVQESLSNIARHAQASEVWVGLSSEAGCLSLTVRDNGVGLPHTPQRRGLGLRGIAERVTEAGGRFNLASAPGVGTALTMSFPLQAAPLPAETAEAR